MGTQGCAPVAECVRVGVCVCVCVWLTARLPLAALLAPCTESLVLIDRLLFFRERNISASLTPLFDKRLSPRNFVLVAKR